MRGTGGDLDGCGLPRAPTGAFVVAADDDGAGAVALYDEVEVEEDAIMHGLQTGRCHL